MEYDILYPCTPSSTSSPNSSSSPPTSRHKRSAMNALLCRKHAQKRLFSLKSSDSHKPMSHSYRNIPPHRLLLQKIASYSTLTLLMFSLFLHQTSAAPQQYSTNTEDDMYNYYYHPDNTYGNGMVSDWNQDWAKMSGRIQHPKCVDIPDNLTLCQGIGYKKMMLPNLLEHDTLKEVTQQSKSWVPLVNIDCHPDTQIFLCSLFSPVCLDREIYPCRSLCQNVRHHCESRMKMHGYDWPEMLYCEKFPVDNDMCIMPVHDKKPDNSNCTACRHPQTHEALIDHYCRSDVAMRVTLKDFKALEDGDMALSLRKKRKFYKVEKMEKKEAKRLPVVIQGGATCSCATINATQEKYLLMGMKVENKIVITFGMVWKRKDKEFKKGIRAIRNQNCQQLFQSVIDLDFGESENKPNKTKNDRKRRKPNKGSKGNRKGKRKKGKNGKKRKGKKGKKGNKGKKGRKGRKGKKGEDAATNKTRKRNKTIPPLEDEVLRKMLQASRQN